MKNGAGERTEGYPSIAAQRNWGRYIAGVATECAFILLLTFVGWLLAEVAMAIWS